MQAGFDQALTYGTLLIAECRARQGPSGFQERTFQYTVQRSHIICAKIRSIRYLTSSKNKELSTVKPGLVKY